MKKRFSEEQIIQILDEHRNGKTAKEIARQKGITIQTIYSWKTKFGDMSSEEAQKLRSLESENVRLKRIVADLSLDIQILKDVNSKKW
jgi:putative transposase